MGHATVPRRPHQQVYPRRSQRQEQVIDIGFARRAREVLEGAGLDVDYHEHEGAHHIDPRQLDVSVGWLADVLKV